MTSEARDFCNENVSIEYTSFNTTKTDHPYCTVWLQEAYCVCFSYGCNSVYGTLYQSLLLSFNHTKTQGEVAVLPNEDAEYEEMRRLRLKNCIMPIVEAAYEHQRQFSHTVVSFSEKGSDSDYISFIMANENMFPNKTELAELEKIGQERQPTTTTTTTTTTTPTPRTVRVVVEVTQTYNGSNSLNGGLPGSGNSQDGQAKYERTITIIAIVIGVALLGLLGLGVFYGVRLWKNKKEARELALVAQPWIDELTNKEPNEIIESIEKTFSDIKKDFDDKKKERKMYPYDEKNHRYDDIGCLEHSRVKLTPAEDPENKFFYHGNYITMTSEQTVLACQAPMPGTIVDFWRLMVSAKTELILMLCRFIEGGKQKCSPYFGIKEGDAPVFGPYKVCTVSSELDNMYHFRSRTIHVYMNDEKVLELEHFEYFEWPDHGIPDLRDWPVLMAKMKKNVMTVHCAAGVGRTGTVVGLIEAKAMLKTDRKIDLKAVMERLRNCRETMIQRPEQFIFLHAFFIEVLVQEHRVSRTGAYEKFAKALEEFDKKERAKNPAKKGKKSVMTPPPASAMKPPAGPGTPTPNGVPQSKMARPQPNSANPSQSNVSAATKSNVTNPTKTA